MAKFDRIFWDSKSVLIESVINKKKNFINKPTQLRLNYLTKIASVK